jgi:hypothetical protein
MVTAIKNARNALIKRTLKEVAKVAKSTQEPRKRVNDHSYLGFWWEGKL